MHHARRKRLTTDDFDKALKWARIEPLHGNQTGCPTHFSPTQNPSVFIVEDRELNLTSATFESPLNEDFKSETPRIEGVTTSHVTIMCDVYIEGIHFYTASWLSVEGAPVGTSGWTGECIVCVHGAAMHCKVQCVAAPLTQ